jgi:hypothetical protein
MALSIGLPFIIVWVIGFPSFVFYRLFKNREKFNEIEFIRRYGLFYVGLNNGSFFWEVIIYNGRKLIFILFNTFFSEYQAKIKVSDYKI